MKKLFFSALVAVVAVGGAFASSSMRTEGDLYSENSPSPDIACHGDEAACSSVYGNIQVSTTGPGTPGRVLFDLQGSGYTADLP